MIKPLVVALALVFVGHQVRAQTSSSAVNAEIVKTANDICTAIKELRGRSTNAQLQVDVQGKLSGLLGKLADVSGGTKGSISRDDFVGLTQDATAIAVGEDRACRERIFNKMFDKLGSAGDGDKEQRYKTALSRLNFFTNRHLERSYLNVEDGIVESSILQGASKGVYRAKLSALFEVVWFGPGGSDRPRVFWQCAIGVCVEKHDLSGALVGRAKLLPLLVDIRREADLDDIVNTLDSISAYPGG